MENKNRQIIVGHANTFHDPAIAIIEGDNIFAEGIERHTQCKGGMDIVMLHYSWRAVLNAIKALGIFPVKDADISVLSSWDSKRVKNALESTGIPEDEIINYIPELAVLEQDIALEPIFINHLKYIFRGLPTEYDAPDSNRLPNIKPLENVSWKAKEISHHLAHASLAAYSSPFEECLVMILDGWGETSGPSFYHFRDNDLKRLNSDILDHNSLGVLYDLVTQLCGFDYLRGEQWKVMGLAAYGKFDPAIYNLFMESFSIDNLNAHIHEDLDNFAHKLEPLVGGFRDHEDKEIVRAADLAHNAQKWFEDTVIQLLQEASKLNLSENLAYGGGSALNSSANGKLLKNTDFKQLHVPFAPADDGNALGVALYEKHHIQGLKYTPSIMSPYLGSAIDLKRLDHILSFKATEYRYIEDEKELCTEVARILADGKIVGWMQGRAEFGPRALGNRSILADPRPKGMKDKINNLVKFREDYRPLAPSILHEYGPEYFEDYQVTPYMERTLPFHEEVQSRVPAAVHEDGTGRLQTVKQEWNPRYHCLISSFHEQTGIPMLINTSFNVMGKPIIHTVEDAITVFYTSGLECLVIDNYILSK